MFKLNSNSPNYYESLMNKAFILVKDDIAICRNQAKIYQSIGKQKEAQLEYDKVNTYFYVIHYFVLIKMYIFDKFKKNIFLTYKDLNDKYSLDTIKETVGCLGVNVNSLFRLFKFNQDSIIGISTKRIINIPNPIIVGPGTETSITNVPVVNNTGDSILIDEDGDIIITNNNDYLDI
jgi:hypothetical protein